MACLIAKWWYADLGRWLLLKVGENGHHAGDPSPGAGRFPGLQRFSRRGRCGVAAAGIRPFPCQASIAATATPRCSFRVHAKLGRARAQALAEALCARLEVEGAIRLGVGSEGEMRQAAAAELLQMACIPRKAACVAGELKIGSRLPPHCKPVGCASRSMDCNGRGDGAIFMSCHWGWRRDRHHQRQEPGE